ncbi:MAG: hypothetical protein LBE71_02065 [Dysgonamonadaceae bacterium]|jgi:hypothetical protein|nr:hypothetical protein [Dysgonamonadaceae bacterium]
MTSDSYTSFVEEGLVIAFLFDQKRQRTAYLKGKAMIIQPANTVSGIGSTNAKSSKIY